MPQPVLPPCSPAARARALDVLLSEPLAPIVDLVAWTIEPGCYEIGSAFGRARFRRADDDRSPHGYVLDEVRGANPVANQDPSHLGSLEAERATPHPPREDNAYPY